MKSHWILGACTLLTVSVALGRTAVYGAENPQDQRVKKDVTASAKTADLAKYFSDNVVSLLQQSCYSCHTDKRKGGLRLDSRADVLKGGESGAVIVPGDPATSLLIQAVKQTGDLKMPPRGPKLKDEQIAHLTE